MNHSHHQTIASLIRDGLANNTPASFRVTSNSMHPLIRIGDAVTIELIHPRDIHVGDVLLIQRESDLLTHRLVAINEEGYHTKADNDSNIDNPITEEDILGRVVSIHRSHQSINIKQRRWINPILGSLGWLENRAYNLHPAFRYPFRLLTRIFGKLYRVENNAKTRFNSKN